MNCYFARCIERYCNIIVKSHQFSYLF